MYRLRLLLLAALFLNVGIHIIAVGLQLGTLSTSTMPRIIGDFGGAKERLDVFRQNSLALLHNALLIPIWKVFLGLFTMGLMTPGLLWNGVCRSRLGRFNVVIRSAVFFVFFLLIFLMGTFLETSRLTKDTISERMLEKFIKGAHREILKMGVRWSLLAVLNRTIQNQPATSFLLFGALEVGYSAWERQSFLWSVTEVSVLPRNRITERLFQLAERAGFSTKNIHQARGNGAYYFGTPFDGIICIEKTTLTRPPEELLGVMAHELGHSAQGDCYTRLFSAASLRGIAFDAMYIFFTSRNPLFFDVFGYETEPLVGALWNAHTLCQIFDIFWVTAVNALEIYKEYDADLYAAAFGHARGLATFLASHGYPIVSHPLFTLLHSSHPPVDRRLLRLAMFSPQNGTAVHL